MMTDTTKICLYFVLSVVTSIAIAPLIIKLLKRINAGQNILGYVVQHEDKAGTPTMGGLIFLLPMTIVCLLEHTVFSLVAMSVTLGFSLLGFLDDFIKIRFNRNLGLKAYQKIIGQVGLSVIVGYFAYASKYVGTRINIPFCGQIDLKWGIIPFVMLTYIATTNSVNLTDGLDGLAATNSAGYFLIFTIVIFGGMVRGESDRIQMVSLASFSACMMGGLVGYLVFNSKRAKVFMGDTGSLGLGAAVANVAVFTKNPLFIVTVGITYVWSSISVIVQVIYYKITRKRVFKMSPFHHHLEMVGWSEPRICALYLAITLTCGALTLMLAEGI